MIIKSMNLAVVATTLLLGACAGISRQQDLSERLDKQGVSAPALTVEVGTQLRFVNADGRPHEIYSNDCPELNSTFLKPGATYTAELGVGPKVCHFQDLLMPSESSYYGAIQIHDAQEEIRKETAD